MKKIQTFISLSTVEKLIFFKAFFLSAYVRFVTLYFPMTWWNNSLLGKQVNFTNYIAVSGLVQEDKLKLYKTRQMVRLACRYAPWKAKCLVESVLVKKLFLRNYNLPIYLGLNKIEDKYYAHAWVNNAGKQTKYDYRVVSVHI